MGTLKAKLPVTITIITLFKLFFWLLLVTPNAVTCCLSGIVADHYHFNMSNTVCYHLITALQNFVVGMSFLINFVGVSCTTLVAENS